MVAPYRSADAQLRAARKPTGGTVMEPPPRLRPDTVSDGLDLRSRCAGRRLRIRQLPAWESAGELGVEGGGNRRSRVVRRLRRIGRHGRSRELQIDPRTELL